MFPPSFSMQCPGSLAHSQAHRDVFRFLRVGVPVAFTTSQGRQIVSHDVPARVDSLESCELRFPSTCRSRW